MEVPARLELWAGGSDDGGGDASAHVTSAASQVEGRESPASDECEGKENRSPRQAAAPEAVAKQLRFQYITVRRRQAAREEDEETKGDDGVALGKRWLADGEAGRPPAKHARAGDMGNAWCASNSTVVESRTVASSFVSFDSRASTQTSGSDAPLDEARLLDEVNASANAESPAPTMSGQGVTIDVTDAETVPVLSFGAVPVGLKRTLQLTLTNPSDRGHARVKYEGYALVRSPARTTKSKSVSTSRQQKHPRFKCDLHVCVVDPEQSVSLRVTFEPLDGDVDREIRGELRFAVNDKLKLRCKVIGAGAPPAPTRSRFGRRLSGALEPIIEVSVPKPRAPPASAPVIPAVNDSEEARYPPGSKRQGSYMLEFSPARPRHPKRRRSETAAVVEFKHSAGRSSGRKPFGGSWWSQRKEFYDENWMAKQEEGFTKWINYVLTDAANQRFADDFGENGASESAMLQNSMLTDRAKARLERRRANFASLRHLAMKRMQAKWSTAALNIYHSPAMSDILFELQEEIANKKLLVRADRPVYADIGLQEELITLLNNYHPVWLCLGLEAVLGAPVLKHEKCSLHHIFAMSTGKNPSQKFKGKMPLALRQVILHHLVKDSQIAKKFPLVQNLKIPIDGSTTANDGGNGFTSNKKRIHGREYYDELMETFILKFLMLVLFLDHAIEQRSDTFAHFPCLFRVTEPETEGADVDHFQPKYSGTGAATNVKKSQIIITEFCRFFLAAEGRIDKHLKQLGYVVSHEQIPMDELNLEVKNLAVDLRDGIILARLMEVLTGGQGDESAQKLSSFLRVPALSRLQKVHNVEICLNYLQEKCGTNILEDVKSRRGVASMRRLAGRVQLTTSGFASLRSKIDEKLLEQLAKDIVDGHREKTLALLWRLISTFQLQSLVDNDVIEQEIDRVVSRMSIRAREFFDAQQSESPLHFSDDDEVYSLMLQWCRSVCANYMVAVHDFTSSFADGRVLCYLLHYYHPMLLSKSEIQPTLSDGMDVEDEKSLLANEKRHFALINSRIKQLGEIPVMMPNYYNSKNLPEEKMVVTFVCYLQSRLMESSKEIHAASRLKRWWMSPLIRLKMRRKKNYCARVIQRFWFTSSAKRLAIRQCRRLLRAGDQVKSLVRTFWERKKYCMLRYAVMSLQRIFRRKQLAIARRATVEYVSAAVTIQYVWRKHMRYKVAQEKIRFAERQLQKKCCLMIEQAWWNYVMKVHARRWRQRLHQRQDRAAQIIQRAYWRYDARMVGRNARQVLWSRLHNAAKTIQAAWLHHLLAVEQKKQKLMMFRRTRAAIRIQSVFRGHTQRRKSRHQYASVLVLQRNSRIWRRRRQFAALVHFHDCLTAYQRMQKEAKHNWELRVLELKAHVRHKAARKIQQMYRYVRTARLLTSSVTLIQCHTRGFLHRTNYQRLRQATCFIQRNYRLLRRRRQLGALMYFYGMLQRYHHMQRDRAQQLEYERQIRARQLRQKVENHAAYLIQATFQYYWHHKRHIAAMRIQSVFRGSTIRHGFIAARSASICIQRHVRGWLIRSFHLDYYAAIVRVKHLRVLMAAWHIENWFLSRMHRYRRRRALMARANWTRMSARVVSIRRESAVAIARCWRSSRLRREIAGRIHYRYNVKMQRVRAAAAIQQWWVRMWWKWHTRQQLAEEIRLREGLRSLREKVERRSLRTIGYWLYHQVVVPRRKERAYGNAIRRVQAWWRGSMVRLHERNPKLIKHRKNLEAMPFVGWAEHHAVERQPAIVGARRVPVGQRSSSSRSSDAQEGRPMTLGSRFEMALHMLLHGKKLQDMLFASHTIEMCTRYSRECCFKCVELRISNTIFAAIRGLNRSRPHVELLHQLLKVLVNLTTYQQEHPTVRKATTPRAKKPKWSFAAVAHMSSAAMVALAAAVTEDEEGDAVKDEVRAVETIVDLLHIHRDMHNVFVLSAKVLRHYINSLKTCIETMQNERDNQMDEEDEEEERRRLEATESAWKDSERRLQSLLRLLQSRAALYAATEATRTILLKAQQRISGGSAAAAASENNLMRRMSPVEAVEIMQELLALMN